MDDVRFDVIVVGAGMAGLACAAELVLEGRRPLLVCETTEVASTLRSRWIGKNRGVVQFLYLAQERFWYDQARRLNIPIKLHQTGSLAFQRRGAGPATVTPYCPTAASLTEVVESAFGFPTPGSRDDFNRVMAAAFSMPWSAVVEMDRVPLVEWLASQDADEITTQLLLTFAGTLSFMDAQQTAEQISVFGALANFRTFFGLEGPLVMAEPDLREGLGVHLANEVERRGGEVWRGRKVAHVLVEDDRAVGVVLEDGEEVRAGHVAIATGNTRIPKILNPMPAEVAAAVDHSLQFQPEEFSLFVVLKKPVVQERLERSWLIYFDENGKMLQGGWPIEKMMPWTTEPGKQLVYAQQVKGSMAEVDECGGIDAVWKNMFETHEEMYPGFNEQVEAFDTLRHRHLWGAPLSIGPKLPRASSDIANLWFVGDGSRPIRHLYTEGAASAGILGARSISAALG